MRYASQRPVAIEKTMNQFDDQIEQAPATYTVFMYPSCGKETVDPSGGPCPSWLTLAVLAVSSGGCDDGDGRR